MARVGSIFNPFDRDAILFTPTGTTVVPSGAAKVAVSSALLGAGILGGAGVGAAALGGTSGAAAGATTAATAGATGLTLGGMSAGKAALVGAGAGLIAGAGLFGSGGGAGGASNPIQNTNPAQTTNPTQGSDYRQTYTDQRVFNNSRNYITGSPGASIGGTSGGVFDQPGAIQTTSPSQITSPDQTSEGGAGGMSGISPLLLLGGIALLAIARE